MNNLSKWKSGTASIQNMNPFAGLRHEVARVMDDFYHIFEKGNSHAGFQNLNLSPAMDLVEEKDRYFVQVEMPGIEEKDVKVSRHNNVLSIQAKKSFVNNKQNENKKYMSREIGYGEYVRNIALPFNADMDKVSATFKQGMLVVCVPKKAGSMEAQRQVKLGSTSGLKKSVAKKASPAKKAAATKTVAKKAAAPAKAKSLAAKKAAPKAKLATAKKTAAPVKAKSTVAKKAAPIKAKSTVAKKAAPKKTLSSVAKKISTGSKSKAMPKAAFGMNNNNVSKMAGFKK